MTKRQPGQGTIRPRKSGGFEGRYYAIRNGERKQLSVYAPTHGETGLKLDLALRNEAMGVVAAGPRLTVADYLRQWLASRQGEVAPKTFATYRGLVEGNIIPALGPIPLVRLSGMKVEAMLRDAIAGGLSPQTAGHIRAVLRTALNRAMRYGMIERNAASDAYPPRIRRRERTVLDGEQIGTLLAGLDGDRMRPLYFVAVATGMRIGEILGLRWSAVDLDAGSIRVECQLQRVAGRLVLAETKTQAAERTIGIPKAVQAVLRGHRATQLRERLAASDQWHDGGYVFTRPDGQPLYVELVDKHWRALRQRLGLPAMTFHDLRGTAATAMHALGAMPREIQAALGHTDSRTTMNLYTHALPAGLRANADRMDVLFHPVAREG
ncbi:MAG: site-specific integrase [Chloroflexota bacterium]|nr:site-specific integrase [Chloroflexota bacterium]